MTNEQLKAWRTALGWSQKEAAKQLGISITTYQGLERGIAYDTGKPREISRCMAFACKYLELINNKRDKK